ncbi:uncharacterized protein N7482_000318 [Penicillium canariense]|uniref:Uncharacterized protein n=1 Tax=Penicillium canariense TaxID=189055 RepID=A0A9W9LS18_9EURO|nr:uncharacterized protein N7482_000318 [Penicillium canariense]KAJ5174441.1 hypothetical protein N7482_000318 [Penicillium canariense]
MALFASIHFAILLITMFLAAKGIAENIHGNVTLVSPTSAPVYPPSIPDSVLIPPMIPIVAHLGPIRTRDTTTGMETEPCSTPSPIQTETKTETVSCLTRCPSEKRTTSAVLVTTIPFTNSFTHTQAITAPLVPDTVVTYPHEASSEILTLPSGLVLTHPYDASGSTITAYVLPKPPPTEIKPPSTKTAIKSTLSKTFASHISTSDSLSLGAPTAARTSTVPPTVHVNSAQRLKIHELFATGIFLLVCYFIQ